jgi:hypothetical protein
VGSLLRQPPASRSGAAAGATTSSLSVSRNEAVLLEASLSTLPSGSLFCTQAKHLRAWQQQQHTQWAHLQQTACDSGGPSQEQEDLPEVLSEQVVPWQQQLAHIMQQLAHQVNVGVVLDVPPLAHTRHGWPCCRRLYTCVHRFPFTAWSTGAAWRSSRRDTQSWSALCSCPSAASARSTPHWQLHWQPPLQRWKQRALRQPSCRQLATEAAAVRDTCANLEAAAARHAPIQQESKQSQPRRTTRS